MANKRTGIYGTYYGSYFNQSEALTTSEQETNARYIFSYLTGKGWSVNSIAGLLGNLENESAINPGRWEGNDVGNGPGYGLVQWTPYTKYTSWCADNGYDDPSEMDTNLIRIIYELQNNVQYFKTDDYPLTFSEFTKSTASPYYLACAFAWNYERSWVVLYGSEAEKEALRQLRGGDANKWFSFLSGEEPSDPDPDNPNPGTTKPEYTPRNRKGLPLWLLISATRKRI